MNLGKLYLGNKMVGKPYFNAPWFDLTALEIRRFLPEVTEVFNPADEDRKMGFEPMKCPNGTPSEAAKFGFDRRKTLKADWSWIAENSDGLIIGPDWETSTGTISEIACHQALFLPVWEHNVFLKTMLSEEPERLFSPMVQLPRIQYML